MRAGNTDSTIRELSNKERIILDTTFYKTREFTGDDARVETLQVKKTDFSELGIYLNKTDMVEDFIKTVQEYQPDLIGLSVVSPTYQIGLKLLRSISDFNIKASTQAEN